MYVLFMCLYTCSSVCLEMHMPENTNKITDVRALTCTTFHFFLTFTASLMMENMPVFISEWCDQ